MSTIGERLEVTPLCEEHWRACKPDAVELLASMVEAAERPRDAVWQPLPGMLIRDALEDLELPPEVRGGLSEAVILEVLREGAQYAYQTGYSVVSQLELAVKLRRDESTIRRAFAAGEKVGACDRLPRYKIPYRRSRLTPRSNVVVYHAGLRRGAPGSLTPAPRELPELTGSPQPASGGSSQADSTQPQDPPPPRAAPRPRAPNIRSAPPKVRAQIGSGWGPEPEQVLEQIQGLPPLSPIATKEDAARIWAAAAAAQPPRPVERVLRGLRELAPKVAGGVEEATVGRAIVYALSARPGAQHAAIPVVAERPAPPSDPVVAVLRADRAAARERETAIQRLREREPRRPVVPDTFAGEFPRRGGPEAPD